MINVTHNVMRADRHSVCLSVSDRFPKMIVIEGGREVYRIVLSVEDKTVGVEGEVECARVQRIGKRKAGWGRSVKQICKQTNTPMMDCEKRCGKGTV